MSIDDHTNVDDHPSLKRARITLDGDGLSLPSTHSLANLEHHPEFWFDDGNIILIAQQTGFRIFRGLLAAQSTVFADMFAAASSQADETLDGCPVVHLTDSHLDVAHLLRILLPTSPLCYPTATSEVIRSFDEVSAVVRLAHKYHIQSVQDQAVRALLEHPFSINCHIFSSPSKQQISIRGAQFIGAVNLSRLTDTPLILPFALYQCSRLGSTLLDGWKREDGTVEHLCMADLKRCIDARVVLGKEESFVLHRHFAPVPLDKCEGLVPCAASLERLRCNTLDKERLQNSVFIDRSAGIRRVNSLCEGCKQVLQERNRVELQRIWDSLPQVFGITVEGWSKADGTGPVGTT
ncbi:hypothetical protein V8D89_006743 [Ganoderma adspersum]